MMSVNVERILRYGHRIECAGSIFACAVSRRFKIVRRVWCGAAAGRGVAAPDARGRLPPAAAAHAPCLRPAPARNDRSRWRLSLPTRDRPANRCASSAHHPPGNHLDPIPPAS
ncbi:hypothetical protein RR48_05953 [Papilio machaon]|uniref:Uncharacterized protein n=1 Tax=Papilio machaon TaxID=76193 RepID=A0A0N0PEP4_PAPMA|nr:hypothetical protein RR48_05953 [Papilio machaon]